MQNKEGITIAGKTGLALGIALFVSILAFQPIPNPTANNMAAIAALMAALWMTEAIPLAATAIFPVVFFPLLGILSVQETAGVYFNSIIFLFLGGFMIAIAMEKWNLHKRVSLLIIKSIGGSPGAIIFGFMISCLLMSMFISNTATTLMMLPIGLAIIYKLEEIFDNKKTHAFAVALMLGIAYASSIGGIATLVGTAPNLAFLRIYSISFPDAPEITFGQWIIHGFPLALVMMLFCWFLITKLLYKPDPLLKIDKSIVDDEYKSLGKTKYEEKVVFAVLTLTGLLWIFRKPLNFGFIEIDGWSSLIPNEDLIDDGTVAIFSALLLFLIPSKNKKGFIQDNTAFNKIPWDIILLFGGGFAIAKGFQDSGLSVQIGNYFEGMSGIPVFLMTVAVCIGLTFLTELTSNTATTHTILPILASISVTLDINPLILMIPATISASFAFMLPVATPPNAIVFSSGRITIGEMIRAGIIMNLVGVLLISAIFYILGTFVFGINLNEIPAWMNK